MMIPMMLAQPKKSVHYALVAIFASIAGGVVGYAIGYFLYESVGVAIITLFHGQQYEHIMREFYDKYGFWVVVAWGFSPIPYKFITIFSGFMALPLHLFLLGSLLGRCLRYFLMAVVFHYGGDKFKQFLEKYFTKLLIVSVVILVVGIAIWYFNYTGNTK